MSKKETSKQEARSMKLLKATLAATVLSAGLGMSAMAEPVVLKFHTFVPMPANSNAKFVKPWADKVTAESNGSIKVEMYPSMQLGGKPPQLVDQVRDGVVDIVWTVAGYTAGRFPRLEVFDLPFMAATSKATSQAAQEFAQTVATKDLQDYKVLTVHVHAPGMFHTKGKLIKSATDLKGLKMRGPTQVISQMLKGLGATPVGMPVPAVAPSLSKGVIDGMVVPWEIMPSFKLQELTKAHTNVAGKRGLYTTPFLYLMNKAKYESLSASQKKVIDANSGLALAKIAGELWDGFEAPARGLAVKAGGKFHTMSGAPLEELKTAGDKLVKGWIARANDKGLDGAMLVKTARELIAKYEK
jgi:TRAP-type C4-dicarboxylate transport system substrate-binding protein